MDNPWQVGLAGSGTTKMHAGGQGGRCKRSVMDNPWKVGSGGKRKHGTLTDGTLTDGHGD